jgi:hypothetical protein
VVIQDSDSPISKADKDANASGPGAKSDRAALIPLLASPLDRFASAMIDYMICLMPLIYLVLSPFQRAIKEAALFANDNFSCAWLDSRCDFNFILPNDYVGFVGSNIGPVVDGTTGTKFVVGRTPDIFAGFVSSCLLVVVLSTAGRPIFSSIF